MKYNVGAKIHRANGAVTALLLTRDGFDNVDDAKRVLANRIGSLREKTVNDFPALIGYAPTDTSVHVIVGPETLSSGVVEFSVLEQP